MGYVNPRYDWRVWWDHDVMKWKCIRWDDKGGMIVAKEMFMSTQRVHTDGKFMRVYCEAKIATANVFTNSLVECDVLRLVPLSQEVCVPVIRAGARATRPGA